MKLLKTVFITTVLGFSSMAANAIPSNFYIEGVVDYAKSDNVYGLGVGGIVTATGMFDAIGVGLETVSFHEGTGNMLDFQFGSIAFNETDDWDYSEEFSPGEIYPAMTLVDGNFLQFDFASDFMDTIDYFDAYNIVTEDFNDLQISGDWDGSTFVQSPKALSGPGTFILLLVGLALTALRRRPT